MIGNFFIQFFIPLFFALGFYFPWTNLNKKKCKIWSIMGVLLCLCSTISFIFFHEPILSPIQLYSSKIDNIFNISYTLSLNRSCSIFLLINSLLLLISILSTLKKDLAKLKLQYFLIFFSYWIANAAMYTENLYSYYLFWELIFIPIFILTGITKNIAIKNTHYKALTYFGISSISILGVIIYMGNSAFLNYGSADLSSEVIKNLLVGNESFSSMQAILFFPLIFSFLIRIPIFPFHSWILNFEKTSPTTSTIVSIGFLANISVYGLIKFIIPSSIDLLSKYNYIFMSMGAIGMIYFPLEAIRQTKIKKLFIYSYLTHISLAVMGIFTLNTSTVSAAIYHLTMNLLTVSGLFCLIYYLETRGFNGQISEFKEQIWKISTYSLFFFIFFINLMPLPLTGSISGVLVIITSIYKTSKIMGFLSVIGVALNIICLLNALYGNYDKKPIARKINDMEIVEMIPVALLAIFFIFCTFFPYKIMNYIGNF